MDTPTHTALTDAFWLALRARNTPNLAATLAARPNATAVQKRDLAKLQAKAAKANAIYNPVLDVLLQLMSIAQHNPAPLQAVLAQGKVLQDAAQARLDAAQQHNNGVLIFNR